MQYDIAIIKVECKLIFLSERDEEALYTFVILCSFFVYFRPAYYKLIEECVSQIILQKSGLDPDFSMKPIDVDLQPLLEELKGKNTSFVSVKTFIS